MKPRHAYAAAVLTAVPAATAFVLFVADGCAGAPGEGGRDASARDVSPVEDTSRRDSFVDGDASRGDEERPDLDAARGAIQHVLIINQENRSFDHYFGTFPGADGIPMDGGTPTVCSPVPDGGCLKPFHERGDRNGGGPHGVRGYEVCVAAGQMNGFVQNFLEGRRAMCKGPNDPRCSPTAFDDVMGYHDDREIPNYWAYARAFALQDRMFAPNISYSLPVHLAMVSGWSATCTPADDPDHCVSDLVNPGNGQHLAFAGDVLQPPEPEYAWTDVTYLLKKRGVTWRYFVGDGNEPDCPNGDVACDTGPQNYKFASYWNVLPWFDSVKANGQVANVTDTDTFFSDLRRGEMAAVNWFIPSERDSEHPPALISRGQAYVTKIVNAVMTSPFWSSTVIFLTWDEWGGFYDHVVPLRVDGDGYGLRVPGLTISPWVKPHAIDHAVYSHDAYLRFIEDVFANGERLDPNTDGRHDSRPTVRENAAALGDLLSEFDFRQPPNAPLVLPPCPAGGDLIYTDAGPCEP